MLEFPYDTVPFISSCMTGTSTQFQLFYEPVLLHPWLKLFQNKEVKVNTATDHRSNEKKKKKKSPAHISSD